jgi:hypothetical protein
MKLNNQDNEPVEDTFIEQTNGDEDESPLDVPPDKRRVAPH